jgi:tetratricopeptide (TPR) repeat protein
MARRTPEALQLLGVAYLVTGEIDRAIPLLEQAVEGQAPHARMLSDLAAAYLVRATRDNRQQDLAKALAAADRAVKADPSLAEALFNRALALERLTLVDEAREAWEEYLRVDDQSGWTTEARTHLQALK